MQDMPPPPIRITIPAGVKPGGAVFVRQASTGANYLVSVPESLSPVRATAAPPASHHLPTTATHPPQGDTFYFVPPTPRVARERSMRPATSRVDHPANPVIGRPLRPKSA